MGLYVEVAVRVSICVWIRPSTSCSTAIDSMRRKPLGHWLKTALSSSSRFWPCASQSLLGWVGRPRHQGFVQMYFVRDLWVSIARRACHACLSFPHSCCAWSLQACIQDTFGTATCLLAQKAIGSDDSCLTHYFLIGTQVTDYFAYSNITVPISSINSNDWNKILPKFTPSLHKFSVRV